MSKSLLLLAVVLVVSGCSSRKPDVIEPSPEETPWLYPDLQIEQLSASDYKQRAVAARALGNMGARAEKAIPHLEKLAEEDQHPKVRELAQEALEKIRAELGE